MNYCEECGNETEQILCEECKSKYPEPELIFVPRTNLLEYSEMKYANSEWIENEKDQLEALINTALNKVWTRGETVIRMRFGMFKCSPMTLTEVGKELGVSGSRIRQIEHKVLRELRHPHISKFFEDYEEYTDETSYFEPESKLHKKLRLKKVKKEELVKHEDEQIHFNEDGYYGDFCLGEKEVMSDKHRFWFKFLGCLKNIKWYYRYKEGFPHSIRILAKAGFKRNTISQTLLDFRTQGFTCENDILEHVNWIKLKEEEQIKLKEEEQIRLIEKKEISLFDLEQYRRSEAQRIFEEEVREKFFKGRNSVFIKKEEEK